MTPTERADLLPGCLMRVFPDGDGEFCATCEKSHAYVWLQTPLIAAAPELLAALNAVRWARSFDRLDQPTREMVMLALAKVEGREAGA